MVSRTLFFRFNIETRYKFSGRQNSAEVSEKKVAPRRFERTQSLPVTKAAQKSNYNSKTAASKSKIQFSGKNSPRSKPIGTNRKPTGSKPNWNLNSSKTPMVQKKHATKTKFENLKVNKLIPVKKFVSGEKREL